MGEVPCLHVEVTGQLAWIDSSLWVLESIQLDILRGKIPWPTEPSSCLTLLFNYRMLILHNNGFYDIFVHGHNIFQSCSTLTISYSPIPANLLPVPSSPLLSCLCVRCVGVCVTSWVSLGWETNFYDVNFMTYNIQLNFKYILNNKFKFI